MGSVFIIPPTPTPTPTISVTPTITTTPTSTIIYSYRSLQTNGTANTSYGQMPYISAYASLTNFTAEFWIKRSAWTTQWSRLFDHNQVTGFSITRNASLNNIQFRVMDTAINSVSNLSQDVWTHISCVRSGSNGYIYINGVLDATSGLSSNAFTTTQALGIGQNRTNSVGNDSIPAKFADIRLWNLARSATQVSESYNRQLTGTETGLIGYWGITRNSEINDLSSNLNAMTTGSAAVFSDDVPYLYPPL
jgi:hypothetical protein